MWYLTSRGSSSLKIALLVGKEYILGRRDCDILIENDPSVSRKHAVLQVTHPPANLIHVDRQPNLTFIDMSKFGTFINNEKISGKVNLTDGDEIRFGSPHTVYCVVYEPFVVTASCLDRVGKKEARNIIWQLGGHFVGEWLADCCLLIMSNINVTLKVVCALASQTHIVTPHYLQELLLSLKGERNMPDPTEFLPCVTERHIKSDVSFLPDEKRSTVFQGTIFFFLSAKQYQKMNVAVTTAGGVPVLTDTDESIDLDSFVEERALVMCPSHGDIEDHLKEWVTKVTNFLKKHGKYLIQEAEVGYAVLYSSTSDYCNANKDVSHLLPAPLSSQNLTRAGGQSSQLLISDMKNVPKDKSAVATATAAAACVASTVDNDMAKREKQLCTGNMSRLSPVDVNDPLQERNIRHIKCEPPMLPGCQEFSIPETPDMLTVNQLFEPSQNTVPDSFGTLSPDSLVLNNNETRDCSAKMAFAECGIKIEKDVWEVNTRYGNDLKADVCFGRDQKGLKVKTKSQAVSSGAESEMPIEISDDEDETTASTISRKSALFARKRQTDSSDDNEQNNPFQPIPKRPKISNTSSQLAQKEAQQYGSKSIYVQELITSAVNSTNSKGCSSQITKPPETDSAPSGIREAGTRDYLQKTSHQQPENIDPFSQEVKPSPHSVHSQQSFESKVEKGGIVERGPKSLGVPLLEGFLRAQKPQEQMGDYSKTDKIVSSVVVKIQDLIVRTAGQEIPPFPRLSAPGDGMVLWNGHMVRNVKKFHKVLHAGAHQLPRIIGGRDLQEHFAQSKTKMDEWLLEPQQTENEESQREREMQELFDWPLSTRPGKWKR